MRTVLPALILCLGLLQGCASHATKLRCEGRLQAINPPAVGSPAAAHSGAAGAAQLPEKRP